MSSTVFVNGVTLTDAGWFNNTDSVIYDLFGDGTSYDGKFRNSDGYYVPVTGGIGKNAIIGGDFSTNPWQRGTSFSSVADGTYTADRWVYSKTGAMVHDISKSADAPTVAQCGRLVTHCLLVDCTTIDNSIAATDYCVVAQNIEGYNFIPLAQRSITLSFWHKHTKTGTYCVVFKNTGVDRSYIAEYTQAVSDTWEKATITVSASPTAGTWDYTNGIGLRVQFCLAAGSTYQTTANAWQAGDYVATSNQVNACDSTSNNFKIALAQLEPGSVGTELGNRTVQQELVLCQRYYEKTIPQGTAPGSGTSPGALVGITADTQGPVIPWLFKVTKRTTPTIVTYSPNSGASGNIYKTTPVAADVGSSVNGIADNGCWITTSGAGTDGHQYIAHATASAEL